VEKFSPANTARDRKEKQSRRMNTFFIGTSLNKKAGLYTRLLFFLGPTGHGNLGYAGSIRCQRIALRTGAGKGLEFPMIFTPLGSSLETGFA